MKCPWVLVAGCGVGSAFSDTAAGITLPRAAGARQPSQRSARLSWDQAGAGKPEPGACPRACPRCAGAKAPLSEAHRIVGMETLSHPGHYPTIKNAHPLTLTPAYATEDREPKGAELEGKAIKAKASTVFF